MDVNILRQGIKVCTFGIKPRAQKIFKFNFVLNNNNYDSNNNNNNNNNNNTFRPTLENKTKKIRFMK
jgi:hypothetical protein